MIQITDALSCDVGKTGVAIDSVRGYEIVDQIPLDEMSVSMTMNGMDYAKLYIVAAEEL
jgi:methylmalonyl-CoA mutase N-terminal domain/subunit